MNFKKFIRCVLVTCSFGVLCTLFVLVCNIKKTEATPHIYSQLKANMMLDDISQSHFESLEIGDNDFKELPTIDGAVYKKLSTDQESIASGNCSGILMSYNNNSFVECYTFPFINENKSKNIFIYYDDTGNEKYYVYFETKPGVGAVYLGHDDHFIIGNLGLSMMVSFYFDTEPYCDASAIVQDYNIFTNGQFLLWYDKTTTKEDAKEMFDTIKLIDKEEAYDKISEYRGLTEKYCD